MFDFLSITECAQEIGCAPKAICNGFFDGLLDPKRCPRVGNRRIIPRDYVPEVRRLITERRERRRPAATAS